MPSELVQSSLDKHKQTLVVNIIWLLVYVLCILLLSYIMLFHIKIIFLFLPLFVIIKKVLIR